MVRCQISMLPSLRPSVPSGSSGFTSYGLPKGNNGGLVGMGRSTCPALGRPHAPTVARGSNQAASVVKRSGHEADPSNTGSMCRVLAFHSFVTGIK